MQAANADMARMWPIVLSSFPAPPGFSIDLFQKARIGPKVRPLTQDVIGDVSKLLWVLMGSIGVVLLIACANVANLMLVRAEGRHHELAVCAALGASPWRIARQFLLESAVLGVLGSALGLVLAWGALRLLVALGPDGLPRLHDIGIDRNVLVFTLGVALFCSLLFGSIPALRYAGTRAGTGLRESRTTSQGRERHRTRNTLVVIQVSLAFVLLICSGLMIRTFRALIHVDAGYDTTAKIQTVRLGIPEADVPKDDDVLRMQQAIAQKIAAVPGVESVSFGGSVPMDGNGWHDPVYAQDRSYAGNAMPPLREFIFGAPGFLKTLGIPLVAGRDFTWDETFQKLPVSMVSENFAREYWGSATNALGKHIRVSTKDDWREIVGVIGDVHADGMGKDAPTFAYWPTSLSHFESGQFSIRRFVVFAIRTPRAGSEGLMKDVRQAVWSVDANLPLTDLHTQDYYYQKSISRTSFHLGDAGDCGHHRPAAGHRGALRRDCVFSLAAHARDRHSHCAGGATQRHYHDVCAAGTGACRERHRVRVASGIRGDAVPEVVAFPCQSRGPDHVFAGVHRFVRSGLAGQLHTVKADSSSQSGGCIAGGIATETETTHGVGSLRIGPSAFLIFPVTRTFGAGWLR